MSRPRSRHLWSRLALGAGVLALALGAFSGCGGAGQSGGEVLTVYVSLPLHGDRSEEGRAVRDGIAQALTGAGGRAGGVRVRAVYLDDTGGGPRWDPVATAENARRAAEDTSTIAFLGDIDDGATRTSLPITNQAEILQVSPGSTAVDLTREVSTRLDPDLYRPSGEQTFVRMVPAANVSSAPPCAPAAYGLEAMKLVLSSIDRAGGDTADRQGVIDAALSIRDRPSAIGTYSVEPTGDTRTELGKAPLPPSCGG